MTIDQILLILALIIIFGLIFGSVYFLPILMIKLRSHHYGLKLDFRQSKILAKNYCAHKDFLIGTREIWKIYPVQLERLVSYFNAGGNMNNLKIGISEMLLKEKEPDITMLTALSLAKQDLKVAVEKAEKNNWKFTF